MVVTRNRGKRKEVAPEEIAEVEKPAAPTKKKTKPAPKTKKKKMVTENKAATECKAQPERAESKAPAPPPKAKTKTKAPAPPPKAPAPPPKAQRTDRRDEELDIGVMESIIEYGGFSVAFAMLPVSKEVSRVAKKHARLPGGLQMLLNDSTATQGVIAGALHLKEEIVRAKPHTCRRRYGGGEYHVFIVASTVRALLRENGGLAGLQERIDAKALRARRAAAREKEKLKNIEANQTPPANMLAFWILKRDVKDKFPRLAHLTTKSSRDPEMMPSVPRPGSTAKAPNRGYWRDDCRRAERFVVLETAGVTRDVRIKALAAVGGNTAWLPFADTIPCRHMIHPLSAQEEMATLGAATKWLAAAAAGAALPGAFSQKRSCLNMALLTFGKPHGIDAIAAMRNGQPKTRAAFTLLKTVVDRRKLVTEGLHFLSHEALGTLVPFLDGREARNFAALFPDTWNVGPRIDRCIVTARETHENRILTRADVTRTALNQLDQGKRSLADRLIQRALSFQSGNRPNRARGGVHLDETLATLRSLVRDNSATRRSNLAAALGRRGLSIRGDSSFCISYINCTTEASLDEVVNTMRITSYLFSLGHAYWSQNATRLENALATAALRSGSWFNAYDTTIATSLITEPHNYYDSDDSDGYYGGARCWDCGGPYPCYHCGRGIY